MPVLMSDLKHTSNLSQQTLSSMQLNKINNSKKLFLFILEIIFPPSIYLLHNSQSKKRKEKENVLFPGQE